MDFINPFAIFVAAVSSLIVGFLWYNPKVFGTIWMRESGLTEERLKNGNMAVIFLLALLFAFMLALMLPVLVIHQTSVMSLVNGDVTNVLPSYHAFMEDYGDSFRTFKHGALHGAISGIFLATPILSITAIFERKSYKYVLVNSGYWIVTLCVMGSIISGWH